MPKEALTNLYRCRRLKDLFGYKVNRDLLQNIEALTTAAQTTKSEYGTHLCRYDHALGPGKTCEGKECAYKTRDCLGTKGEVVGKLRAIPVNPNYLPVTLSVRDILESATETCATGKSLSVCACKHSADIRVSECLCAVLRSKEAAAQIIDQAKELPPDASAEARLREYTRMVKETRFIVADTDRFC